MMRVLLLPGSLAALVVILAAFGALLAITAVGVLILSKWL